MTSRLQDRLPLCRALLLATLVALLPAAALAAAVSHGGPVDGRAEADVAGVGTGGGAWRATRSMGAPQAQTAPATAGGVTAALPVAGAGRARAGAFQWAVLPEPASALLVALGLSLWRLARRPAPP